MHVRTRTGTLRAAETSAEGAAGPATQLGGVKGRLDLWGCLVGSSESGRLPTPGITHT